MFRVVDGIMCGSGSNKVGRDEFRALMDELVEGMLAVRSGCSPNDRL